MEVEVFVRVRCAGCAEIVVFCEADYRGQVYCGGGCKGAAGRETKARDQRSREGRFDHAARNVVYRARRHASITPVKIVTDTRSGKLAAEAMSCVRDDASASVVEEHAVVVESTDDGTNHSDDAAFAARDAAPRDGGEARSDEGDLGPDDGEPPAGGGDAARGPRALAPAGAVCCVVCGRRGVFVRDPDDRRPRLRNEDRPLRRRGRLPRPPPRGRRIHGLGNFGDLRQLCLEGVES